MRIVSSSFGKASVVLFTAGVAAACSGSSGQEAPRMCTLIGCESGLEVTLDPRPAGTYRVEAAAGGLPPQVVECAPTSCAQIFFRDFTPDSVTIRVIAGADAKTWSLRPSYRSLQPNGPGCPPTCRQATIRLSVP